MVLSCVVSKSIKAMKTIQDLRKALKPLGFTIKCKSLSWGYQATYVRKSDGMELCSNVFTPETLAEWRPLLSFVQEKREELTALRNETGIIGLVWR